MVPRPALLFAVFTATVVGCAAAVPPPAPPAALAGAPRPGPARPLAAPGPAAAACADDAACGAHRCNVAAGKCAFPCETDDDCSAGAQCVHGSVAVCVPRS